MSLYKGNKISLEIYGASHAPEIGVKICGLPSGIEIDEEYILSVMKRRAPSGGVYSTQRREGDIPVFLSGVKDGFTDGDTVHAVIYNKDTRSKDYSSLFYTPRPGHADYTARVKYKGAEDTRGGGAFSGRMTAPLCIAGAIALKHLEKMGITIGSHVLSVGNVYDDRFDSVNVTSKLLNDIKDKEFKTVSDEKGEKMLKLIDEARRNLDSVGGVVEACAVGIPAGLGGELFDGIESKLARLIFSIPAVKGFEIGAGYKSATLYGSNNNDGFYYDGDKVKTYTNNHGGILGGITSGMPLTVTVAIKPTPSIAQKQKTVNLETKQNTEIEIIGRHDACIVPRVLPVIESAIAITLLEEIL